MTPRKNDRDRITFDLKGLRERLEAVALEPEQPLTSVLRATALIGLEILEVCNRLGLPTPKVGGVEQWLKPTKKTLAAGDAPNTAAQLFQFLSSPEKPSDVEIVEAASRFKLDTEELMDLCDRLQAKEHCKNGH